MQIQTVGHASMVLRDEEGKPILLTDPWLVGSCYWRSWWLQNYPTETLLEELSHSKYVYITHEHPDHYHLPSIRKLGNEPTFLAPGLPEEHIARYLTQAMKLNTRVIEPMKWTELHKGVQILCIPLPNDDSVLLVDTGKALIINVNDSKPMKYQVKRLGRYIAERAKGKKVIVLSSYSPASPVNSFRKDGKMISLRGKEDYVTQVSSLCNTLKADFFIPFASQVIFYRPDSKWANEYKVTFEDLTKFWKAPNTKLLRPFSKINLETFEYKEILDNEYNHNPSVPLNKVEEQAKVEAETQFSDEDIARLQKKLRGSRWFLWLLFPRGIGFKLDHTELTFKPFKGKVIRGINKKVNFILQIPALALKEALIEGYFSDLGITMFTIIILNRNTNPKAVYLFFLFMSLHDYKHTISIRNFFRWFKSSLRFNKWKLPVPPLPSTNVV